MAIVDKEEEGGSVQMSRDTQTDNSASASGTVF